MLDGPLTDSMEAIAFNKHYQINDIYSCRWAWPAPPRGSASSEVLPLQSPERHALSVKSNLAIPVPGGWLSCRGTVPPTVPGQPRLSPVTGTGMCEKLVGK